MVDLIPILWTEINSNQPTNQGNHKLSRQLHHLRGQKGLLSNVLTSVQQGNLKEQHLIKLQSNWLGST